MASLKILPVAVVKAIFLAALAENVKVAIEKEAGDDDGNEKGRDGDVDEGNGRKRLSPSIAFWILTHFLRGFPLSTALTP